MLNENKKSIWDGFTHKYKLTKTLRFELKPQGETKENIKKFISSVNGIPKGTDAERAKSYKVVKRLLDEMHRHFIDEVLKGENVAKYFKVKDIKDAFSVWKNIKELKSKGLSKKIQIKKMK